MFSLQLCINNVFQNEQDSPVSDQTPHIFNIGKLVEDLESKIRSMLADVYFGKTQQILNELRTLETSTEIKNREELAADLQKAVNKSS